MEPYTENGGSFVRVGAGCKLQDLLDRVHAATDRTMPTLGAIKKQAIAGAASTATHGSGRPSLSHFVSKVRIAAYDPATGIPKIFEYTGGNELKAARCGLGCMGIVLSLDLATVPKYQVTEIVRPCRDVKDILAACNEWPLTQFILMPHSWGALAYHRKRAEGTASGSSFLKRHFFRLYNWITTDILFHLGVITCRRLGPAWVRTLLRMAPFFIIKDVERTDEAEPVLTMSHYYFQHEEMEVFVRQSRLIEAVEFVRAIIDAFAGSRIPLPEGVIEKLRKLGLAEELETLRGSFFFHYPIFFRRILPEEALISMASSTPEPYFSISFFAYDPPEGRGRYYALCSFLARSLNRLFEARLHWGKHFPLQFAAIAPLYPEMEKFRTLCMRNDPNGVFRNTYTERVLNLPRGSEHGTRDANSLRMPKEPT